MCNNYFQKSFRDGSHVDKESLRRVFKEFWFDVRIFEDLKVKNLCYSIEDLAKYDFSSYASLVVCILSHRNEGAVAGVDGKIIKINELKYKFNSNHCPTLNGKPKIWIIQACQGSGIQYPIQPNSCQGGKNYTILFATNNWKIFYRLHILKFR